MLFCDSKSHLGFKSPLYHLSGTSCTKVNRRFPTKKTQFYGSDRAASSHLVARGSTASMLHLLIQCQPISLPCRREQVILSGNTAKSVHVFTDLGTSHLCFVCPWQPANSTQGTEKAKAVEGAYTAGSLKKGGTVPGVLRSMLVRLPSQPPCSPHLPSQFTYNISVHLGGFWARGPCDAHFPHPPSIPFLNSVSCTGSARGSACRFLSSKYVDLPH